MYCQSCGKQLRSDARFCHECGTEVTVPQASSEQKIELTKVVQSPDQDILQFYQPQQEEFVSEEQELIYSCPFCNEDIKKGQNKCPSCQEKIDWEVAEMMLADNQTDLTSHQYDDSETDASVEPIQTSQYSKQSSGTGMFFRRVFGILEIIGAIIIAILCMMNASEGWYYVPIGITAGIFLIYQGGKLFSGRAVTIHQGDIYAIIFAIGAIIYFCVTLGK